MERYGTFGSAASIRLGPSELDHLGPLLGFGGNELGEVGGRTGKHCSTKVGKPRLQLGIDKARVDLPVELIDDLGGRFLGRANALQRARLVASHEVAYGRDVWQYLRTRCGRHRQRT